MIVVETSALVALYRREQGSASFRETITRSDRPILPISAFVEFAMLRRIGANRLGWLRDTMTTFSIELYPLELEVGEIAAEAAIRFGRGSRHPARLNFGDCLSYAVAKHLGAPLLYKGDDFVHTDIESALPA
jgi:ribonuclease VapC